MKLTQQIPDADSFLSLEPEVLAGYVLEHINALPPNELNHLNRHNFTGPAIFSPYRSERHAECQRALMEAWSVLEREGLIAPKPYDSSLTYFVTRRGQQAGGREGLSKLLELRILKEAQLADSFRSRVIPMMLQGAYESAVFEAYKTVEVAVREAGGFGAGDYGVALMRKAFKKEIGPLTDASEPEAEQQALQDLFAGAVGRFKNPSSHRHVAFENADEAAEMVLLANHLLRIVSDRRAAA